MNDSKIPLATYCRSSVLCGLGFSIPYSLVIFYGLSFIVGMPVLLRDTLILQLYVLLLSLVSLALLGVILWLPVAGIDSILRRRGRLLEPLAIYTIAFSVPVFLSILMLLWMLIDRPFDFRSRWFLPVLFILCAICLGVGISLKDIPLKIKRAFSRSNKKQAARYIILILCAPLLLSAVAFYVSQISGPGSADGSTPPTLLREETGSRLVIICLDGATWDIMDGMIERGKLPNIKFLMDNGSYGPLLSNVSTLKAFTNSAGMGMRTPAIWESIFTGKKEKKHGIFDFAVMRLPLMKSVLPFRLPVVENVVETIPTTSTVRKCTRSWEIISKSGLDVGVVGLWSLWPAEPIERGYVITSRIQWATEMSVYPPDLLKQYPKHAFFTDEKAISLFLSPWKDLERDSIFSIIATSGVKENFNSFRRHFKRDNYMAELSVYMLENHPTSLYITYFWGPDFASHLFWKYMDPTHFDGVRKEDIRLFGDIIRKYYSFLDDVVGKHIAVNSLDVTYLILSDHGFGAWEEEGSSELDLAGTSYSGKHRRKGIIILAGENIKRGVSLSGASIFDITPTILTLFGLPVALDMDGRPLTEVIEEGFLERHPVRYIDTYETGEKMIPVAISSDADAEIKERLKALGYIR
ncbi:MAG: alkaline phosphatase family protein [Candidatus Glassbacteria bacterium]